MDAYQAFGEATALTASRPSGPSFAIQYPLEINLVISDLDGTLTPTYMALEAAHLVMNYFGDQLTEPGQTSERVVEEIADFFRDRVPFENILHAPEQTLMRAVREIARAKDHPLMWGLSPANKEGFINNAFQVARNSFDPFDGAEEFLEMTSGAGTAFNIFTNTRPRQASERLARTGLAADKFGFIYARAHDNAPRGLFSRAAQAFASRLRIYREPKPNPKPILEMQHYFGARPATTLMIGEGSADFWCVRPQPIAHFAFQAEGARMSRTQVETNERLRPGRHPLGMEHVERECGISSRRDIIHLHDGFRTLVDMVHRGLIVLKPSPMRFGYAG